MIEGDKWGKDYKVKDGERIFSIETTDFFFTSKSNQTNTPKNYQRLLYGDTLDNVGWRPYLTFDFVVVSHRFSTTPLLYKNTDLNIIQNKIWELYNEGMTYTRIHQYLVKNGYDVSPNKTTVDSSIKKRI